jgi:hypothetical protein
MLFEHGLYSDVGLSLAYHNLLDEHSNLVVS